ncbi:MAG: hypothetical protein IT385_07020 [Deltaproteobacteria bacterium]|nr:hypothetical protein [Deltaproteobacteria bacterium]
MAAHAEEGEEDPYPIVYGQRPITLNAGQSVPAATFLFSESGIEGADMGISLLAAFDYGVIENLTAGVSAPFMLSPEGDVGNPHIYGRYRFLRGATPVELGVELGATFPVVDGTDFGIDVSLLGKYQINKAAQLRFGLRLDLVFADELGKSFGIPLDLAISFTRNIFFELNTGVFLPDFEGDLLTVPLGIKVGYTLPKSDDEPLADIFLGFSFPGFLGPTIEIVDGVPESSTGVNTDAWTIMLGGRIFL